MAGTDTSFDAAEFRRAITFAMTMGAAPEVEDQPLFFFPSVAASGGPSSDEERVPFDPDATQVLVPSHDPVRVPCGLDYKDDAGDFENLGVISQSRLILTFLDVDYDQIKGFSHVMIHGDRYDYQRTEPPRGLFEVGVFRVVVLARDES